MMIMPDFFPFPWPFPHPAPAFLPGAGATLPGRIACSFPVRPGSFSFWFFHSNPAALSDVDTEF